MTVTINPKQAATLLTAFITSFTPMLLTGAPGVGKSSIVKQAAQAAGYDMILSHPVVADPTTVTGLPWPDHEAGVAKFLPFGDLHKAMTATKPTVWFLDDLGQAAPAVQASFMQLLLAREINGQKLPDCVTFVAATNRRSDRAGVSGILTPVLSRFGTIVELHVSVDDWVEWALDAEAAPELISFLRFRPDLLHDFDPSKREMENFPCPRTWGFVGQRILNMQLQEILEYTAIAGAVGEGAAIEFRAFLSMVRSNLPSIEAILSNPDGAAVPERPDLLWAVTTALTKKAAVYNCGAVFRYAERLHAGGKSEFAALMVKDIERTQPVLCKTPEWAQLVVSDLGKSFLG